ncbi:hypothetical protein [Rufibacter immobilis]|uniref:hypothetical protein n=1 Tax=Rufibacter immobilis TaxID=1348778 RepID=UPI0035E8DBCB
MKNNNKSSQLLSLFITYVVVKIVHYLVGFAYDPFTEGLLTSKLLIDFASWAVVYLLVYFIVKKASFRKSASV